MKTKDFYINSIETMLRGTSSSTVEATYKAVRALTQVLRIRESTKSSC